MKHGADIEKRVEETLNSLDGIKRATPQPWLFSRIKARLIREEAEEMGAAAYLRKPFSLEELRDMVERVGSPSRHDVARP